MISGVISCEFLSLRLHLSLRFGRGSGTVDDQSGQYRVPATPSRRCCPDRDLGDSEPFLGLGPDAHTRKRQSLLRQRIVAPTVDLPAATTQQPTVRPDCGEQRWDPRYALLPVVPQVDSRSPRPSTATPTRGVGAGALPSNSGRSDWRGQRSVLPIDMACRCSGDQRC